MRNLRVIRIFLSVIFFAAAVAYLFIGPTVHPMAEASERVQIIPSAIAVTLGATLVWLFITFLFGRVYCSTVCPVGTLQDIALRLRNMNPKWRKRFSWKSGKRIRYHIAAVYLICLMAGVAGVPYLLEPWNIMRNIASTIRLSAIQETWLTLGIGGAAGIAGGLVSILLLTLAGAWKGRDFCNTVCPIGTGLGLLNGATLYQIEIDPDRCTGCLKCEDVCRASCIKVVGRYVDNSRCVRCFDCLHACEDDAIRFQKNRNQRATPLLRKKPTP